MLVAIYDGFFLVPAFSNHFNNNKYTIRRICVLTIKMKTFYISHRVTGMLTDRNELTISLLSY